MSKALLINELGLVKSGCQHQGIKYGYFSRFSRHGKHDGYERVQRYRCKLCGKIYSDSTDDPQKLKRKSKLLSAIFQTLVSGVSQRRAAIILNINRKTLVRKFRWLGDESLTELKRQNLNRKRVDVVEFDDLETIEHTKCKPLSVTLAVEVKSRHVLGFEVSRMPAKGKIAALARKKYGYRKDERAEARERLFQNIKEHISETAKIKSDQNPHYVADVKKHFPKAIHENHQGRDACVTGQGELKRGGFDPLFSINHTFAKLRADINRLFRRTWCTTKKPYELRRHIAMMVIYHNFRLGG